MEKLEERMNIIACRLRASNYSDDYIDAFLVGYAEGYAEGIAIGEEKKTVEIARKLKQLGASLEMIQNATDLSAEEILKL